MPQLDEKQDQAALDPLVVKARAVLLDIEHRRIAKELCRTKSAISHAFGGDSPVLLARINRYLDRVERTRAKRQQGSAA